MARSPDRSGVACPATFAGAEVSGHAVLRQYLSLRGRATRSVEGCDMHNLPKSRTRKGFNDIRILPAVW
ncbi:hypothetical protein GGE62_006900 [Rhizobium leguminosarum]|nr:hypothetical protein [Rhizobium leguminosarum]